MIWSVFFVAFAIGFLGGKLVDVPFVDTVAGFVLGFTGLILVGLWHVTHPLAVDFSPRRNSIEYEFRDLSYAQQFAELNGRRVRAN